MKNFFYIMVAVILTGCDWTVLEDKPGFVDKSVFISSEQYALYRWDVVEDEKFSILANHIKNPQYVCIADLNSSKRSDKCDREMHVKIDIHEFPAGTTMEVTGHVVTVEYRGIGNFFKGPSRSSFHKVLIEDRTMWLPDLYYRGRVQ